MIELYGIQYLKLLVTKAGKKPITAPYRPEIDTTNIPWNDLQSWYIKLIGVLRWVIEPDNIEIMNELSVLSQHQCNPREFQLNSLYGIFFYLKCELSRGKNPNVERLVYYARQTEVYDRLFCSTPKINVTIFILMLKSCYH